MKILSICALLFSILFFHFIVEGQKCRCLPAFKEDFPSSGNVMTIIDEGKVKSVQGIVNWMSAEPMEGAVIEVYKITEDEIINKKSYNGYSNDPEISRDQKIYDIVNGKKRNKACKTISDGKFCFNNLKKGKYILKIGLNHLLDKSGMNSVYFVVEVDKKSGKNHQVEAFINVAS